MLTAPRPSPPPRSKHPRHPGHLLRALAILTVLAATPIVTAGAAPVITAPPATNPAAATTAPTGEEGFVTFSAEGAAFVWIDGDGACPLLVDSDEDKGVRRAVATLQTDAANVSGQRPRCDTLPSSRRMVIIGTVEHSRWIQQLLAAGKLSRDALVGKREKYLVQVVAQPLDGVDEALVIAGSDKRGAIYGIYALSAQMGVSPWYFWADVPIVPHSTIAIKDGIYSDGEPQVKYRGIFINDEWPALGEWAKENYGDFNSAFYEKVFELILRLRGNFLWPAMWRSAFYDDDPQNGALADEMGIVIGTSHHEPMCEAQQDWKRRGTGDWDYTTNGEVLRNFWRDGIRRSKEWETVVTIGMRGDGDTGMSEGTNIALLEEIIRAQRAILAEETQRDVTTIPQVWALYKEVQDYYDSGMRVPDDITLLLCDDNWGNVRKLPAVDAAPRKGGYGMYYHLEYVGAPRNSKWALTSQIQRVWEQMTLCYEHGVRELWVVNVGDIKPLEYPMTFFLDMAWDPTRYNETNLLDHTVTFCQQQFGDDYATEIAPLLDTFAQYNRRVTPELLSADTYSLDNYDEWQRVRDAYRSLCREAHTIGYLLDEQYRAAYDQLVLFPITACANLYDMYYAVAQNHALAAAGDSRANYWAEEVERCFRRDSLLTDHYNHVLAGGKWNHIMDQVHIGYTRWNDPPRNIMPAVENVPVAPAAARIFQEKDGYVAIEAEHYTRSGDGATTHWIVLPNLGRTLSAVTTAPLAVTPDGTQYLDYVFTSDSTGGDREVTVYLRFCPTLNYNDNRGLSYAVSLDDGDEQIVNINGHYRGELGQWQQDHIITSVTTHTLAGSRHEHTLRYRPLDEGLVLQRVTIDTGGMKPSFLGPPESATP